MGNLPQHTKDEAQHPQTCPTCKRPISKHISFPMTKRCFELFLMDTKDMPPSMIQQKIRDCFPENLITQ